MTTKGDILAVLSTVYDPEIGMNIVDLGLVYGVDWDQDKGLVHVDLTLTSPSCPLAPQMIRDIKRELWELEDVLHVDVDLVWKPMWHPSMMSDYAKGELGYDDEFGLGFSGS